MLKSKAIRSWTMQKNRQKQWKEEQLAVMEEKMQKAMTDAREEGERVQAETLSKIGERSCSVKRTCFRKGRRKPVSLRNSTIGIIKLRVAGR